MSNGLTILGSSNNAGAQLPNGELSFFWQMEELENAVHFDMPAQPDVESLFVEFDELTAAGTAYKQRGPLNMLDLLLSLETLAPGFHGIILTDQARLMRQRLSRSSGLSLEIAGKTIIFQKEETLQTLNFLDFFNDFLKDRISGGLNGKDVIETT
jgi:hypothetical protein